MRRLRVPGAIVVLSVAMLSLGAYLIVPAMLPVRKDPPRLAAARASAVEEVVSHRPGRGIGPFPSAVSLAAPARPAEVPVPEPPAPAPPSEPPLETPTVPTTPAPPATPRPGRHIGFSPLPVADREQPVATDLLTLDEQWGDLAKIQLRLLGVARDPALGAAGLDGQPIDRGVPGAIRVTHVVESVPDVGTNRGPAPPRAVAEFWIDGGKVKFRWDPARPIEGEALRDCVLKVVAGRRIEYLALRRPIVEPRNNLTINLNSVVEIPWTDESPATCRLLSVYNCEFTTPEDTRGNGRVTLRKVESKAGNKFRIGLSNSQYMVLSFIPRPGPAANRAKESRPLRAFELKLAPDGRYKSVRDKPRPRGKKSSERKVPMTMEDIQAEIRRLDTEIQGKEAARRNILWRLNNLAPTSRDSDFEEAQSHNDAEHKKAALDIFDRDQEKKLVIRDGDVELLRADSALRKLYFAFEAGFEITDPEEPGAPLRFLVYTSYHHDASGGR